MNFKETVAAIKANEKERDLINKEVLIPGLSEFLYCMHATRVPVFFSVWIIGDDSAYAAKIDEYGGIISAGAYPHAVDAIAECIKEYCK